MNFLFVHGFMGSALNWSIVRPKLETLAKKSTIELRTHAVDLLGHASRRSSQDLKNFQSAHHALTHELFLDIKDYTPTIALGHSFGIRPLLLLAHQKPDLIPALIIEDASPELSPESCAFLQRIIGETPTPFRTRESAREYFDNHYPPQVARFLLSNIRSFDNPEINDWRFDREFLLTLLAEAQKMPLWEELRAYKGQCFILTGEKSPLFSDSQVLQKIIQTRLPQKIDHYEIKNSGHWIHADQKDEFCRVLIKIISSI